MVIREILIDSRRFCVNSLIIDEMIADYHRASLILEQLLVIDRISPITIDFQKSTVIY